MTNEPKAKFKEMADIIYGDDKISIDCALEDLEAEGELYIFFDNYADFEARYSEIENACWARGLIIEQEGGGYIIRVDK